MKQDPVSQKFWFIRQLSANFTAVSTESIQKNTDFGLKNTKNGSHEYFKISFGLFAFPGNFVSGISPFFQHVSAVLLGVLW